MPTQPTTSPQNPFLSEILDGSDIPEGKLAYFRARLRNRLHELILSTFQQAEEKEQLTRARLASRIARKPEQITRWFSSASNLEIATVSDLLLGMGFEPQLSLSNLKRVSEPATQEEFAQAPSLASLWAANDPQRSTERNEADLFDTPKAPQHVSAPGPKPELASAAEFR